ncbi:MAG: hypothetical protein B6D59_04140 [Campylobacteraceae bacterium 4484_4]|nr:MAG: hypothetical protein B6D59_04140 [Campylobacteraceae bacterium 4484_4]
MHIEPDCIACIFNQALRVTKELGLSPELAKRVLDESAKILPSFDMHKTPPENATPMYHRISKLLQKEDLYKEVKERSIAHAKSLLPLCERYLEEADDLLETATKIAVVGNVIDLASEIQFDLSVEIEKILHTPFAIDDTELLRSRLQKSRKVVYLADNAGENVFDMLYIKTLRRLYPDIAFFYFVRHRPIINDITFEDLEGDSIHTYATVVDSGVVTPGLIRSQMSKEAQKHYRQADLILSKGMGNYECLNDSEDHRIFFLLKVKCSVVARSLDLEVGEIICKAL